MDYKSPRHREQRSETMLLIGMACASGIIIALVWIYIYLGAIYATPH